jgi:hypothetical protein
LEYSLGFGTSGCIIPCMQLHAVSIGQAVPRENFDAVIQSAFDSAVNLRLTPDDRLITVLLSDHYELPQGIRIARKEAPLHSLTVNLRAAARAGVLRFDSFPLAIDLRSARVWNCPVPHLEADLNSPGAQEAWSTAWELLNKGQRLRRTDIIAGDLLQTEAGSPLSQRMSSPVMQLISATEQFDVKTSIQAAQNMIGLGPGVTPSGDDILIGFLAGLWSLAGGNQPLLSFIHSFGSALVQIATQTSEISRTYLYHATQGQFSSSLSNLAEAIARHGIVKQAAQIAMRLGHSSGMDSVTGLLIGLSVWKKSYSPT